MKILTWQNPGQLFVAQALINNVKLSCCGIKVYMKNCIYEPVFGLFLLFNFQIDSTLTFSSRLKNEICNSDKIIFDQLEIEPIEIQKDTVAIDNEISANVRGKVAFRKIICSANILSQSVSQSAHRLGLFFR